MDTPLFLITGTPGSGKSTVSEALLKRYDFGIHIPVDSLREWVVSGIAHPVPAWTAETSRQFALARAAAIKIARLYQQEGFAVVIDDVIGAREGEALLASLASSRHHRVLLRPSIDVALARNASRTNKAFDTSVLEGTTRAVHEWMSKENYDDAGWLVLDSSQLSVEQTVDAILEFAGKV